MLSVGLTLGLFGLVLSASLAALTTARPAQVVVAFSARAIAAQPDAAPAPRQARTPAARIAAPQPPAPDSAPPQAAPAQREILPVAAIDLQPRALPMLAIALPTADVPAPDAGGVAQAIGSAGADGSGDGGDGSGGAGAGGGGGKGGRKLFASWAPDMDFARDDKFYPPAARAERVEGVAWMRCLVVRRDRVRDCRLIGESPQGYGFGEAALKTVPGLRIRLRDERGRRVYDDWTIVTSTFSLDDLPEHREAQATQEAAAPEPTP